MIICPPLFREVEAAYGILGDSNTAFIIKIVQASGLTLLKEKERNTYIASFYFSRLLIFPLHYCNCLRKGRKNT